MPLIAREARRDRGLALPEQQQVHGHLADGDLAVHRADRDPGVGTIERRACSSRPRKKPQVSRRMRQRAVLPIQLAEDRRGSGRAAAARARTACTSLAWSSRAITVSRYICIRVSGERQRNSRNASPENLRLGDEGRQARRARARTHGPGREADSRAREAHQRDRRSAPAPKLRITSDSGPAGGFAPRARELVVELRVLEVLQVERQRLLEDHLVDALAQLRAQQRLAGREPRCVAARAARRAGPPGPRSRAPCDRSRRRSRRASRSPRPRRRRSARR